MLPSRSDPTYLPDAASHSRDCRASRGEEPDRSVFAQNVHLFIDLRRTYAFLFSFLFQPIVSVQSVLYGDPRSREPHQPRRPRLHPHRWRVTRCQSSSAITSQSHTNSMPHSLAHPLLRFAHQTAPARPRPIARTAWRHQDPS